MPKKAKVTDETEGKVHKAKPMGDGQKLRSFLDRVAECQSEIDAMMDKARLACETHRQDIKEIKKEAREAGFAAKEFNTLIRKERLEHRLENIAENLDDEQKERFEDMLAALGQLSDTPLGKAAASKHPAASATASLQ